MTIVPSIEAGHLIVAIMGECIGRVFPTGDPLNPHFSKRFFASFSSPALPVAFVAEVERHRRGIWRKCYLGSFVHDG
jgi:hypothetical protein